MKYLVASLAAAALLGGCGSGSNPFEGEPAADTGTGTGTVTDPDAPITATTPVTVPAGLAGNVTSVSFDPTTETVLIEGLNLDEVPVTATYRRRPGLDQPGYLAFTAQDDPLDRHFTAYVAQSNNSGSVRAGTVGSPGPRNRFFGGAFFERDGDYTPPDVTPTTGLVSYAGTYVGVTNQGTVAGADLREFPTNQSEELRIPQARTVTGEVFLNADFADNSVEGNIVRRKLVEVERSGGLAPLLEEELPSLVLVASQITANGTFNGTVEYDIRDPRSGTDVPTSNGAYGGVFGGPNADGVAGAINLTNFDGVENTLGLENELETGIFVLDQCGQAVSSPICTSVNPTIGTP
ncbi:MAG: thymidylate synthase [Roseovarius sp.]|nr:thymidylate synthase [Roseovarius sp.]